MTLCTICEKNWHCKTDFEKHLILCNKIGELEEEIMNMTYELREWQEKT